MLYPVICLVGFVVCLLVIIYSPADASNRPRKEIISTAPVIKIRRHKNNTPAPSQLSIGVSHTTSSDVSDVVPAPSQLSIGANHTTSSDVSDVIDVDFVATYKQVRATASSEPAQGLTVAKLIKGAKRAAQFPAGYFHAACDFPQVDTPRGYTKSQQPLANFARIFKLSRDDHKLVINNQSWRNSLLHCFAKATDAELYSVCHRWSHLTSGDTYNYIYIINFVLVLRNEANN